MFIALSISKKTPERPKRHIHQDNEEYVYRVFQLFVSLKCETYYITDTNLFTSKNKRTTKCLLSSFGSEFHFILSLMEVIMPSLTNRNTDEQFWNSLIWMFFIMIHIGTQNNNLLPPHNCKKQKSLFIEYLITTIYIFKIIFIGQLVIISFSSTEIL